MSTDKSTQETLTRRQFLIQAAVVGGTLATPVNLFGQMEPAASGESVATTELRHGWLLKAVESRAELTAEFFNEAEWAAPADGWLPIAVMPAMVPDVLLAHEKIEAPWLPGGTEKCFWMGQRDWVYALRFAARPGRAHRLRFRSSPDKPKGAPQTARQRPNGSYLGPNPDLTSVGIFDQVLLESSDGNTLEEAVADAALDESLSQGTLTITAAGASLLPSVSVRVRLLDPEGGVVAETSI